MEKKAAKQRAYRSNAKLLAKMKTISNPLVILMAFPTIPTKVVAALNMSTTWGDRVKDTLAIYNKCFTNPNVTFTAGDLANFMTLYTDFKNFQEEVDRKVAGAAGSRDIAWEILNNYLVNDWKWKVQAFANSNPNIASTIITSCNYSVKVENPYTKSDFSVKPTTTFGQLKFMISGKNLYKSVQGKGNL